MNPTEIPFPSDVVLASAATAPCDRAELRRQLRAGSLTRVMRGVYAPGPVAWEAQMRIALAITGPRAAISHTSAARCWGWGTGLPAGPLTLTRYEDLNSPGHRAEIAVFRRPLPPSQLDTWRGLPITGRPRTLLDVVAALAEVDAVRWLEVNLSSMRSLMDEALALGGHRSGMVRRRLLLADESSESWLETAFRLLVSRAADAQMPVSQYTLTHGGRFIARFDFAWPGLRIAVELDGRSFHETPSDVMRDRDRHNGAGALRWIVLRFTWADVVKYPEKVLAAIRLAMFEAASAA